MATEQIPATQFQVGGQQVVTGWVVVSSVFGFEEDAEDKQTTAGQFKSKLTYSRRRTLQLTLEAENATTVTTWDTGGSYTHDAVLYIIRNVQRMNTRGPVQVTLDLISSVDQLA